MSGTNSHGRREAGFDAIRLAAAAMVFFQHACTLTGRDDWAEVGEFRVGRFGTAVFFALSGYFAAATTRSPAAWLGQRVRKLFPAYWAVLAVSFPAAGWVGLRSFDAAQVVAQFAGVGLFTHPGRLVNVTTWFVSALLVLYLVAYLGMLTRGWAAAAAAVAAAAVGVDGHSTHSTVAVHAVTFLAAYLLGRAGRPDPVGFLVTASILVALSAREPTFCYGALALSGFAAAAAWPGDFRPGRAFAAFAYEWFLVHGLCLHAVVRLAGPRPEWVFPLGVGTSVVVAVGLHRALDRAAVAFRLPRRSAAGMMGVPSRIPGT